MLFAVRGDIIHHWSQNRGVLKSCTFCTSQTSSEEHESYYEGLLYHTMDLHIKKWHEQQRVVEKLFWEVNFPKIGDIIIIIII